jgi:hypothetical protein
LTKRFDFTAAHYELNLLGLMVRGVPEKTAILLAQGSITMIGDIYE